MFEVEKVKCLDGTTKCPILKRGRFLKVKNLTTKWQIFDYRGENDALDRILEILQEDDDDEDAEFEGFLPNYQRYPPLNFQNFEFDLQPPDFTGISGPRRVSSQHFTYLVN